MIITTTPSMEGRKIVECRGIVVGEAIRLDDGVALAQSDATKNIPAWMYAEADTPAADMRA
ncbi:heavy metal-binding domain-containing protein [Ruegeria sediminis]|uniref:Heavy metal-binding domain-containing protein n=2 Tax=Ruegeria sediminis TaxID=2583820 RepID=A0ABY2X2T5_9RHOB|nr:heavy metal-binding domain-containing protein [Ruegeria sediminis]